MIILLMTMMMIVIFGLLCLAYDKTVVFLTLFGLSMIIFSSYGIYLSSDVSDGIIPIVFLLFGVAIVIGGAFMDWDSSNEEWIFFSVLKAVAIVAAVLAGFLYVPKIADYVNRVDDSMVESNVKEVSTTAFSVTLEPEKDEKLASRSLISGTMHYSKSTLNKAREVLSESVYNDHFVKGKEVTKPFYINETRFDSVDIDESYAKVQAIVIGDQLDADGTISKDISIVINLELKRKDGKWLVVNMEES